MPMNYPRDFFVPTLVVNCLKPLDSDVVAQFTIGLGTLWDDNTPTFFALVWFLDQQKLGIICDYTSPGPPESCCDMGSYDSEEGGWIVDTSMLKHSFAGVQGKLSMALLEGDYRLMDGQEPQRELEEQLNGDTTFSLEPFAYQGFDIEDACRYKGDIQPMEKEAFMHVIDNPALVHHLE